MLSKRTELAKYYVTVTIPVPVAEGDSCCVVCKELCNTVLQNLKGTGDGDESDKPLKKKKRPKTKAAKKLRKVEYTEEEEEKLMKEEEMLLDSLADNVTGFFNNYNDNDDDYPDVPADIDIKCEVSDGGDDSEGGPSYTIDPETGALIKQVWPLTQIFLCFLFLKYH